MAATVVQTILAASPASDGGANAASVSAVFSGTPPVTGHLLIASFTVNSGGAVVTPPAGWTELTAVDQPNPLSFITFWVGYRYRVGGDSNTITFGSSITTPMGLIVREISGMVVSNPLDIGDMIGAFEGTPYSVNTDIGTAAAVGELVLLDGFCNIGSRTGSWNTPVGFTRDAFAAALDGSGTGTSMVALHSTNASTAIAAQTLTLTQSGFGNADTIATQYVIKPAAGSVFAANVSDTDPTMAEAVSAAQIKFPPTPADQASSVSDSFTISVVQAGLPGTSTVRHIQFFRRGYWI